MGTFSPSFPSLPFSPLPLVPVLPFQLSLTQCSLDSALDLEDALLNLLPPPPPPTLFPSFSRTSTSRPFLPRCHPREAPVQSVGCELFSTALEGLAGE